MCDFPEIYEKEVESLFKNWDGSYPDPVDLIGTHPCEMCLARKGAYGDCPRGF